MCPETLCDRKIDVARRHFCERDDLIRWERFRRLPMVRGGAMSNLIRTGISLESSLLERFDRAIHKKGYRNRSEAIRDLVRDYAVAEDVEENRTVVGTLTLVYDHHRPKLTEQLIEAQHDAENKV